MGALRALRQSYREKQRHIRSRLRQFRQFYGEPVMWTYAGNEMRLVPSPLSDHERLFEELAFCILAANTSAEMGMKTIDHIRHLLHHAEPEEITARLRGIYRFINTRPEYIAHCRHYFRNMDESLHDILRSLGDPHGLRDFLADNAGIKGIGYKEASHFLRNLGFRGYAILDKHIINSLHDFGVIPTNKAPSSKNQYLALEQKYLDFAGEAGIPPDELDLLLWSNKTGKILK